MKIPRTRKEVAPRNVAAKALRLGQFQPKVGKDPKAYTRKPRHRQPPLPDEENGEGDPPRTGWGTAGTSPSRQNPKPLAGRRG